MKMTPPTLIEIGDTSFGPISLSVHDQGAGVPVVFCHGFPDLAYGWRYQLPAVADAGFRAIAMDQRGYGASSAPEPIEAYGLGHLTQDLVSMLDRFDIERAVFVGHDWGGFVVWAMPLLFPERVLGVASCCTPYTPFPTTDFLKMMVNGVIDNMYMLWFQEPGVAEGVLDAQVALVFHKLLRGGINPMDALASFSRTGEVKMNPFIDLESLPELGVPVDSPESINHYIEVFERTGFRGGINWYRNIDANAAAYPQIGQQTIDVPSLMICAEWDMALPPALAAGMPAVCSDLEMHTIEAAGHWVPQEKPEQVNALLIDWLTRRFT